MAVLVSKNSKPLVLDFGPFLLFHYHPWTHLKSLFRNMSAFLTAIQLLEKVERPKNYYESQGVFNLAEAPGFLAI